MTRRPVLIAMLLLGATLSLVPGASACVPGRDLTAGEFSALGSTYYERFYTTGTYWYVEVWRESNGEAGLQTNAGMSCTGKYDKLVHFQCIGYCPIQL